MPSTAVGSDVNLVARNPDDPAVSFWPEKKLTSCGSTLVMFAVVSAEPVPDSAVATDTRALNPELDAAGLVMPYVNLPAAAACAICAQVGGLVSQPRLCAMSERRPNTTGELMMCTLVLVAVAAPGSR